MSKNEHIIIVPIPTGQPTDPDYAAEEIRIAEPKNKSNSDKVQIIHLPKPRLWKGI